MDKWQLSLIYLERSHSGRVRTLGKRVVLNGARGFESPPLLKKGFEFDSGFFCIQDEIRFLLAFAGGYAIIMMIDSRKEAR